MELRQLRTFRAVVREGSVTDAAVALDLAPSSVSQAVRTLEDSLGVPLFVRGPRGMRTTAAGQHLLAWADRLLADAEQARREVVAADAAGREVTTVKLGALESIAAEIVPSILARLERRRPGLRVEVRSEASRDALLAAVEAGELDAALVLDTGDTLGGLGFPVPGAGPNAAVPGAGTDPVGGAGPAAGTGGPNAAVPGAAVPTARPLDFLDLEPVPLVLVGAPGHPFAGARAPLAPADFDGGRLLVNTASSCSFALAANHVFGPRVERVQAGSVAVMRAWARQGVGVALLPAFAVASDLAAGTLAALDLPLPVLNLRLTWPPARASLPATRELLYAAGS